MEIEVLKWGNSAAVRLPALVLRDVGVSLGQCLELTVEEGKVILTPKHQYQLDELVKAITPENCHAPAFDDAPKGHESW